VIPVPASRFERALIGGLLALAMIGLAGCRRPPCEGMNVVLVVIDTLRADHLGCYGYDRDTSPRIDAVAEESILFERAEAAASWTLASTATILTGLYPFAHGLVWTTHPLSPDAITLPERLQAAGYATYGYSANNIVSRLSGFDQGFDRFVTGKWPHAGEVNAAILPWIEEAASGERPFFLYVHYLDPHDPYDDPAGYYALFGGRPDRGKEFNGDAELKRLIAGQPSGLSNDDVANLVARYDGEIRFVDEKVGELIDFLRSKGLFDRTLVLLTSDHGEQFLEHGWVKHGATLYEEETHVPFLIRVPGEPKRRIAGRVDGADVTPTILDLLGVPPGRDVAMEGVSLYPFGKQPRPEFLSYSETQHFVVLREGKHVPVETLAIRRGRHKLIHREGLTQLFDLDADPLEKRDLAAAEPERARSLRDQVHRWKLDSEARQIRQHEFDPGQAAMLKERMRALGYLTDVDSPAAARRTTDRDRAAPAPPERLSPPEPDRPRTPPDRQGGR
jgi:arylsulfatase A-like enzyme